MTERDADPWFERGGDWWVRSGDGSEHRLLDLAPTLERDALKDADHMAARRRAKLVGPAMARLPDDAGATLEDVLSAYIDDVGDGARPFLEDLAAAGYVIVPRELVMLAKGLLSTTETYSDRETAAKFDEYLFSAAHSTPSPPAPA